MKKVAVTVAVLALGLAACADNDGADNVVVNDTYVENEADSDLNLSMNETENQAGNALDAASNAIENADEAVENAADAVDDATN